MLKVFGLLPGYRLHRKDTYFKYSLEEQFTGKYWINGKKIYCKTIYVTQNNVAHNIANLNNVIHIDAIFNAGNTYGKRDGSNSVTIQNVNIYLMNDISTYVASGAYITIYYTKTTN